MGRAARSLTVILLLACPAQAGYMQNEKPAPPPPQPVRAAQEPIDTFQEPTSVGFVQDEAADGLTRFALDVLAVLPSLL
jgi:hypothetical protein